GGAARAGGRPAPQGSRVPSVGRTARAAGALGRARAGHAGGGGRDRTKTYSHPRTWPARAISASSHLFKNGPNVQGAKYSQVTCGFQSANTPCRFFFHAQTCSS